MELTAKQQRFVEEYVIDFNATQAAIRAGYSEDSAADIGYENLRKPEIVRAIEEKQSELRDKAALSAEMVIDELRSLAFWNIQTFVDEQNGVKKLAELSLAKTRPVLGIKVRESILPDGTREIATELKFHDKRGALSDLGKHLGIFKEDNQQRQPQIDLNTVDFSMFSREQIIAFLQQKPDA